MFTCFIHRKTASISLDGNTPLSARTRVHLASCPACRAAYGAEREIGKRLARNPAERLDPVSPFLHGRIMARVERAGAADREPGLAAFAFLRHPAIILSCLILFTVLLLKTIPRHPSSAPPSQALAKDQKPLSDTLRASQARLAKWSGSLDQPLNQEMQLVATDAKAAVQFLSHNFLPQRAPRALRSGAAE